MKLENEDELDRFIICKHCHTLHEDVPTKDGTRACCSKCGAILYRNDSKFIDHGLALSMAGLIFFMLANLFPLVKIEILGHEQFITITQTFISLFDSGFYVVGLICSFLIFIFPLMIFSINMLVFTLLKRKKGEKLSKELLLLLSHITPWNMSDIFLISILVALVKLIGYAQIHMGMAFWALMAFVLIDLYLSKSIDVTEIWRLRKRIFSDVSCMKENHS